MSAAVHGIAASPASFQKEIVLEYEKLKKLEPAIQKDMEKISSDCGMKLAGLEHAVKSEESVLAKAARQAQAGRKPEIGDAVRFTAVCGSGSFTRKAEAFISELKERGYRIWEIDNKFTNPADTGYVGLHLGVYSFFGRKYEVQMHTYASLAAKNKCHGLYKEYPGEEDPGMQEMRECFRNVKIPQGIRVIGSYRKEDRN